MSTADYEKLLKQGDVFAGQGKSAEALEQYAQARTLDPNRQEAHKQIINIGIKKEDFDVVFREYLEWADYLKGQGKLDEAFKVLQEAVGLETHYEKRSFLLDKKSSTASKLKEHFLKFSPTLYEHLGEIAYENKDHNAAIELLDKALELAPRNTKIHCLLGVSYLAKGQLDKAKGPFQEVVRFQGPEAALAYEKLAEIYSTQGNTPQMVIWLKDAAEAYIKNDQLDLSIKALEKILEVEPSNKEILNRLAEIYSKAGNVPDAIRIYKHLAEIYSQAGIFDKVIVLYEKLVEWEPDNVEIINHIIDIYRMSLQVDPGNLRARIKLIENLLRQGSVEEVVSEYLQLIDNYVKIGLLDEAINCCERVLQFEPTHAKAREVLAELYAKTGQEAKAEKQLLTIADDVRDQGEETKASELTQKAVEVAPEKTEREAKIKLMETYEAQLLREMEELSPIAR